MLLRPGSLLIPIELNEIFKMRYITSLNSHWLQNGKPSKLNDQENVRFTTKTDIFSDRSILTACHFGSSGSSEM